MLVLGIESTCDETGCAIVRDGCEILSNIVASQVDLQSEYGGVVPELACRRHIDMIIPVIHEALIKANVTLKDIDVIAVANGPGLIGALLIGLNAAKGLALSLSKPLVGVNHVEAHLYAALMDREQKVRFPCLGVVLSGGHTALVKIEGIGHYALIGETIDDAIGEAFDKVAKILGLPYPGGPEIEALAKKGDPSKYTFKAGRVKERPFDFSFSGLKTSVLYAVKGQNAGYSSELSISEEEKKHVAAAFQETALNDIVSKTLLTAQKHECHTVIFGGGVTNNKRLRDLFSSREPNLNYVWPASGLSLDNAAMIAGLGYHQFLKKGSGDGFFLEAITRIGF